jgi:hypothetical protein
MSEHTMESLCVRSHDIAKEKGWLDENGHDARSYAAFIALCHSEVSEALEEYRKNKELGEIYYEVETKLGHETLTRDAMLREREKRETYTGVDCAKDFKPCGIPIEIADLVIRVAQRVGSNAEEFDTAMFLEESLGRYHLDADVERWCADVHRFLSLSYHQFQSSKCSTGTTHGVTEKLASAVVYAFSFCGVNKISLWAAIDEKEAYNRTRPARHGGKKI